MAQHPPALRAIVISAVDRILDERPSRFDRLCNALALEHPQRTRDDAIAALLAYGPGPEGALGVINQYPPLAAPPAAPAAPAQAGAGGDASGVPRAYAPGQAAAGSGGAGPDAAPGAPWKAGPGSVPVDPKMSESFIDFCEAALIATVDDNGKPVSSGFFVSPNRAITVYHDVKPRVGDKITCITNERDLNGKHAPLRFVVTMCDERLDFVLMDLSHGQPERRCFFSLPKEGAPLKYFIGAGCLVLNFGIAAHINAGGAHGEIDVGLNIVKTSISCIGSRHFAYPMASGQGDSGGAVILNDGVAVGLHLGGWNNAPTFDEGTEDLLEGAPPAIKRSVAADRQAVPKRCRAPEESSVARSHDLLASTITVGGWALYLGSVKQSETAPK